MTCLKVVLSLSLVLGLFTGCGSPSFEPEQVVLSAQPSAPPVLDLGSVPMCRELTKNLAPFDDTPWTEAVWKQLVPADIKGYIAANKLTTTSQSGEESQVAISGAEIANPELARQAIREYLNDTVRNTCLPIEPRVEAVDLGLSPRQMEVAHIKPLEDGTGYYQEPWPVLIRGRLPTEQRVRVYKLKITSLIGDPSYAYMLVPMSQGPHPLAVVAHQTLATCGAREPLGACPSEEQGLPWQAHGMKLAGDGFIVVMPDMIGYGTNYDATSGLVLEYDTIEMRRVRQFFPKMSVMAAEVIQLERFTKAMFQLAKDGYFTVLGDKVAVSGHSKGGYDAVFFGALHPELVKFVLSSAGAFNYPLKGPYGDDLSFTEAPTSLVGIDQRVCGWGYSQGACPFTGVNQPNLAIDFPVIVRALLGKGQGVYLIAIEDDRLARQKAWDAIRFSGNEGKRQAELVGGEFWYGVVESGLKDKDGATCLADAVMAHQTEELRCAKEEDPADQHLCESENLTAYYRAIFVCQLTFGRNHGIYYDHINRGFDALYRVMMTGEVHDYSGTVYVSDGAPARYPGF